MSRVSDILAQMAANAGYAARARGAILGSTVANVSQLPEQIIGDRQRQRELDLHAAQVEQQIQLEQARGSRESAAAQRQTGLDARAQTAQDAADLKEHALKGIIGAGFAADPATFDLRAAVSKAQEIGAEDLIPTVMAVHEKMQPQISEAAPGSAGRYKTGPKAGELVPNSLVPERSGVGNRVINGQLVGPDGAPIGAAIPSQKSYQKSSVLLDGKPAEVLTDPTPGGKVYDLNGAPIDNAAARVKPIPPASFMLQAQGAEAAKTAPPVDASRPDPAMGNKIDPATGMTANGVYQAALVHALEGKLPALGFGQTPRAMAVRMAITNKSGALAAAANVDLPTLQAEYRANANTLNKILPIATQTAASAGTAMDNLQLAIDQSGEVARTGAKLVNRYVQWAQGELTPAKGLSQFETYVYTAAREYAKVVSGASASVAGLTDSASKEAEKLLNTAQAPETFKAVAQAMQNDMGNVTANQRKQIANVSSTIGNFFATVNPVRALAVPTPSPAAPGAGGAVAEGTTRPITDPGYPPGAEQTFRNGQWIRTK